MAGSTKLAVNRASLGNAPGLTHRQDGIGRVQALDLGVRRDESAKTSLAMACDSQGSGHDRASASYYFMPSPRLSLRRHRTTTCDLPAEGIKMGFTGI